MQATALKEVQRYRITMKSGEAFEGDYLQHWNDCINIKNVIRFDGDLALAYYGDIGFALKESSITEILETARTYDEMSSFIKKNFGPIEKVICTVCGKDLYSQGEKEKAKCQCSTK